MSETENKFKDCTDADLMSSWRWLKGADSIPNLPATALVYYVELKKEVLKRGLDKE